MNRPDSLFVEVEVAQICKHGQTVCGDTFISHRIQGENRITSVLSDGLGSGIKANILSSMTATMALKFVESNMDFTHSAEVMMDTLPVCQIRHISYATFTVVDTILHGWTRIIEMDSPASIVVRDEEILKLPYREITSPKWESRKILQTEVLNLPEDRIVIMSDGVTQSAIGSNRYPLGWGDEGCQHFVRERIKREPHISAKDLASSVLREAMRIEDGVKPGDDTTCAVMYFRKPRKLILLTGPPFSRENDSSYASMIRDFDGKKVVCGGTSADIVGRELGIPLHTSFNRANRSLPPQSFMKGIDLITEGILTLTETLKHLETGEMADMNDPASTLARLLLDNDVIEMVIGTKINEAHQDPNMPVELEIRRNIAKKISAVLSNKYLKEVSLRYI